MPRSISLSLSLSLLRGKVLYRNTSMSDLSLLTPRVGRCWLPPLLVLGHRRLGLPWLSTMMRSTRDRKRNLPPRLGA